MIELVEIMIFELRGFVEAAYEGDDDLLTDYHVRPMTYEEAVEETLAMISITSVGISMRYFGVLMDGDKIGYLVTFENNLYSFSINIDYRCKSVLSEFWDNIVGVLGDSFVCLLYPNNTRAINWLLRNGMVEVPDMEENCVTLLKVKERVSETIFSHN